MKFRCKTAVEKGNLICSITAGILMLAVYILYLLKPSYADHSTGYAIIRKFIIRLVDCIPFVLLIVFAILQKTDRFRNARWMPLILAATRLFVDLISVIAREYGYVKTMTFDMLFGNSVYIIFIGLIALMCASAFFSRYVFSLFSFVLLCMYSVAISWVVMDEPSFLRTVWGLASFLWYCAFLGFSSTINNDNKLGVQFGKWLDTVIKEILGEDESDDEQPVIDMLYNEFQKIMVYGMYSKNTAVLKAAANLKEIGEKRFINSEGCVIEKEYVREQYSVILEFATDDETAKIGSIHKDFTDKLQQLLDGYNNPDFLMNAVYYAVIFCGNLDYGIYTALTSVNCEKMMRYPDTSENPI